jgi:hypothetical protein
LTQNNKSVTESKPFVSKIYKVKGEDRWLVQSKTNPSEYHHVSLEGCDCKGFEYRKTCRHLEALYQKIENEINQQPKKPEFVYEP